MRKFTRQQLYNMGKSDKQAGLPVRSIDDIFDHKFVFETDYYTGEERKANELYWHGYMQGWIEAGCCIGNERREQNETDRRASKGN